MSALVARDLSGFDWPPKEGADETNGTATGGAENAFRGGLRRLAEKEPVARGSSAGAWCVCRRTFRRLVNRYEEAGLEGLIDKRLSAASRRAPDDEVFRLLEQYKGKHRKRRERAAWSGMMLHQDGSKHEWAPGVQWDLILTMDDATNEHYSLFFVEEEGTLSIFQGVKEVLERRGLFSSFYTDWGSHYWTTPEAGGKVDKVNLTQFGRAMKNWGIHMSAAYSPEARGRCEQMFCTHQERLPKEWPWPV